MRRAVPYYEVRDDADNLLIRTQKRRLLKLRLRRLPPNVARVTVRRGASRGSVVRTLTRREDGRWLLDSTIVTDWSQLPPEALSRLSGKNGTVRQVSMEEPAEIDIREALASPAVRARLASAGFEVMTIPEADPAAAEALIDMLSRKRVYC